MNAPNETNKTVVAPFELIQKYDKQGPRYTSYPTVPVWSDQVGHDDYAAALQAASQKADEPLSIYAHLPFCEKRCYFCGCNVFIPRRKEHITDYITAFCADLDRTADALGARNKVMQLHFGGGTPTHLSVEEFAVVMDAFEKRFELLENAEVSIEVDPRVTTKAHLVFLAERGFNRISMGVQDFNEKVQKSIGREQPYDRTRKCIEAARELGFKSVNLDLIYGLPHQTVETFSDTIKKTITLSPDRLAVYSFAFLPERIGNQKLIRKEQLPNPYDKYQLSIEALKLFTESGYCHIGMDHFALPDDELTIAQSEGRLMRNFMGYTVNKARDLVGLGISSIGLVNNTFVQNTAEMDSYIAAVNDGKFSTVRGMKMSDDDLLREFAISSIMCNFVLRKSDLKERFAVDMDSYFSVELSELDSFYEDELLVKTDEGLQVTALGRSFVRNIAMTFDAYLRNPAEKKPLTFSRTI